MCSVGDRSPGPLSCFPQVSWGSGPYPSRRGARTVARTATEQERALASCPSDGGERFEWFLSVCLSSVIAWRKLRGFNPTRVVFAFCRAAWRWGRAGMAKSRQKGEQPETWAWWLAEGKAEAEIWPSTTRPRQGSRSPAGAAEHAFRGVRKDRPQAAAPRDAAQEKTRLWFRGVRALSAPAAAWAAPASSFHVPQVTSLCTSPDIFAS